jgi:putative peptidoglycan lipid II flippase
MALWPTVGVLAVPIATVASGVVEVTILCGMLFYRLHAPAEWHITADTIVEGS